jgi:hypothetical protein
MSSDFPGKVLYHILEIICYVFVFVPPVILIWRYRCWGFFAGVLSFCIAINFAAAIMTNKSVVALNPDITTEFIMSGKTSIFHPKPNDGPFILILLILLNFFYCGSVLIVRLYLDPLIER